MKRLVIAILISCRAIYLVEAQLPILVKDDFNDNVNDWGLGSGTNYSAKIENGKFTLTTLEEDKGRFHTVSPYFDYSKDFSLEATFVQKSGLIDNGLGLIWGKAEEKYYTFTISSNGYYMIGSPENRAGFNKWTKYNGIKPIGQTNRLRVYYNLQEVSYYINDKLVATSKAFPLYGNGVGFISNTKMVLEIDDFVFYHDVKINLLVEDTVTIEKENLGSTINSIYDEVSPKISATGVTLFFGRKHSHENEGGVEDKDDVWSSTLLNGTWTQAKNMGNPINSKEADNLISLSTDENTMIFALASGFGERNKTALGWANLKDVGIQYTNEDKFMEGCLASDGKAMLFTIMSKENVHYSTTKIERDIYVALKNSMDEWSPPVNLGSDVNTGEDEYSPFLSSDGKTLYFASKGWPGYGDADIFMTKRLDDSWKKWSIPINLGPSINSSRFDAYYSIPASGEYAYMCTSFNSLGKSDIIRVKLPANVKPDPVVLISGRTLNAKSKEPISADIKFDDLKTAQEMGEAISNAATGNFYLALPYGYNYGLHAAARGFLSVNENIELLDEGIYKEVQKDLYLVPIEIGESFQLNNVFFEQGKVLLMSESYLELDRLAQVLIENTSIHIEVSGHTDNIGNPKSLKNLSKERVTTVKNYLISKGVLANRIVGHGYGATRPIEKNDSELHRKLNRRVEFKITKK